jgi:hypothetical protein
MKRSIASHQNVGGHVLLMTVCTIAIIGLVLVGYIRLSTNQNHLVVRSQVWNLAIPVAEAGIDEAMAHCNQNYGTNMVSNGWAKIANEYWKTNVVGTAQYVVRISETQPYVIHSKGSYPIPGTTKSVSRTVRVRTKVRGPFIGPIAVKSTVSLNGNNVKTDSYDSTDPLKSTLGRYDPLKAGDKGDVACMGGVVDSFDVGNANIWGHAYTGPNGTLSVGPMGAVGSVAWQTSGKSGVQDGWWLTDYNSLFPDVQAPFTTAPPPAGGMIGGTNYDYILGSGNYMSKTLTKKVVVTGNAVLYVTDQVNFAANDFLEIMPGASLTVYMAGQNATFSTIVNHNASPAAFMYFGLPGNTSVKVQGSAGVTAAFYAPYADITLNGGGEICGCVAGKKAVLTGSSKIHYDESLLMKGPFGGVSIASWDEL